MRIQLSVSIWVVTESHVKYMEYDMHEMLELHVRLT